MTREEAIFELRHHLVSTKNCVGAKDYIDALTMAIKVLKQKPKTGYWIDDDGDNAICSCCNRLNHLYGDYCKHCGAKMEVKINE